MEGGHGEQRAESQQLMITGPVLMFSVTLVHFHVLSVGTVLERSTQSSASSASSGCIRGAAVSRAELLQTQTMLAQGVMDKLVQLMAEQSHK